MSKAKAAWLLFLTMFKIGLFTFGGGYAMIALLENEFVSRKKWMEEAEFLDMVALAESTPGPIAINSATYIGYRRAGVLGSAAATVGVCLPSFLIIYAISLFFDRFLAFAPVQYAFDGIRVAVVLLILSAGWKLLKGMKKNLFNLLIFSLALAACLVTSLFALKFSTVFYILIGGFCGLLVYLISRISGKERGAGK